MGKNPFDHHSRMYQYVQSMSVRETAEMIALRNLTAGMEHAAMQISPDQGQLMAMLVKLTNARHIIEVGTFTGYSALCMALALPGDGKLVACDISDEWTSVGREYWQQAGIENRIDLRIAPAVDTLKSLLAEGGAGQYDMAFIDADKSSYDDYYELCLALMRPNGLIMIDNVFWEGKVIDLDDHERDTDAIRALNSKIAGDQRVDVVMLSVADGMSLVRKL